MENELKPCPFCGNKEVRLVDNISELGYAWVSCPKCYTEGPTKDANKEAMEAWNSRAEEE